MTNTDIITDHILDEINTRGYFLLSPDKWTNYGNAVKEIYRLINGWNQSDDWKYTLI